MSTVADDVAALKLVVADLQAAVDTAWVLQCGAGVFLMQAGLALVEAGSMRSKNVVGVLLKNFIDVAIGALVYYLWGYGFSFGKSSNPNNFIGTANFAIQDMNNNAGDYAHFFFQFTFCATAATIVSGACAERVDFGVYMLFSVVVTGWIYPVIVHSLWSTEGWLSPYNPKTEVGGVGIGYRGAMDFAGSGVVHIVGGIAAIIASTSLGPRCGRFVIGKVNEQFPSRSAHMTTLGTFLLFFSWYFFNCGSSLRMTSGGYQLAARAAMATTLSGMMGALSCFFIGYFMSGRKLLRLSDCLNGALGGLVAITAGCAVVNPWAAVIVGILSGATTYGGSYFTLYVLLADDPVDAFAVHGLNGMLGVLVPGFFASEEGIAAAYGIMDPSYAGVFMGGDGHQLAYQVLEIVWIASWTASWSALIFYGMKRMGGLRLDKEMELGGADVPLHEGLLYERAWSTAEVIKVKQQLAEIVRMKKQMNKMQEQLAILLKDPNNASLLLGRTTGGASSRFDVDTRNSSIVGLEAIAREPFFAVGATSGTSTPAVGLVPMETVATTEDTIPGGNDSLNGAW